MLCMCPGSLEAAIFSKKERVLGLAMKDNTVGHRAMRSNKDAAHVRLLQRGSEMVCEHSVGKELMNKVYRCQRRSWGPALWHYGQGFYLQYPQFTLSIDLWNRLFCFLSNSLLMVCESKGGWLKLFGPLHACGRCEKKLLVPGFRPVQF